MVVVTIIQLSFALFSRQLPVGGCVGLVFEFGCGCSSPVVVVGLVFESGWIAHPYIIRRKDKDYVPWKIRLNVSGSIVWPNWGKIHTITFTNYTTAIVSSSQWIPNPNLQPNLQTPKLCDKKICDKICDKICTTIMLPQDRWYRRYNESYFRTHLSSTHAILCLA